MPAGIDAKNYIAIATRSMRLAGMLLAIGLASVAATPSWAADPVLEEATDLAGAVMFAESGAPGMVLVIVRGGESLVRGYGETERGNHRTPAGDSIFRLNSITKVFLAEVLVSLAADGRLSLTDALRRYAGDAVVPAFGAREITLVDLATHSAALPREMPGAPSDAHPRAWPSREERWQWLAQFRLPWSPGTIAAYSNIGFDLLADASETAGGRPYPELLAGRVTRPLGMVDTGFAPTPVQCTRPLAGPGIGGSAPCVHTHATDGSSGLYSTRDDMARWLRHTIAATNDTLTLTHAVYRQRQALQAAIGFDEAGPMTGLGLDWIAVAAVGVQPRLMVKSSGGVGFMSYAAFTRARRRGVRRGQPGRFRHVRWCDRGGQRHPHRIGDTLRTLEGI